MTEYKGVVLPNEQVASFYAKHGAAAFSKPHGAGKTILYYVDTEAEKEKEKEAEAEDFAGQETPATRDMVIQGSTIGVSNLSSRVVRAGKQAKRVAFIGNPNRAVEGAKIENEDALDEKVTEVEKQYMEKRLEQGPEAMGLPALSLGEKVQKVEQQPIEGKVEVELPSDKGAEPTYGPDLPPERRAPGDEGGNSGGGGEEKADTSKQPWDGKS